MKVYQVLKTALNLSTWEQEWVSLAVVVTESQYAALVVVIRHLESNPSYSDVEMDGEEITAKLAGEEVKISLFPVDVWQ